MIFLTVGTQLPFDRLIKAVDDVAADLNEEIFGQIGFGTYKPRHFTHVEKLSPVEFAQKYEAARLIIGHAGMGTVLTGAKYKKPLALMARRAEFNEHRNDHQMATSRQFSKLQGVHIFTDAKELRALATNPNLEAMTGEPSPAKQALIDRLAETIRAV